MRRIPALLVVTLLVAALASPAPATAAPLQDEPAEAGSASTPGPEPPSQQQVYVLMRDMGLSYEQARIQTIVPNEAGASVLVGLEDGTLADVELVPAAQGWTLRDIFYVAGDARTFRSWIAPWQRRLDEAERFIAAASDQPRDEVSQRARELAPLIWFEDLQEDSRLWGLNPMTYRVMQTLRMMPALGGPMQRDNRNPRFDR